MTRMIFAVIAGLLVADVAGAADRKLLGDSAILKGAQSAARVEPQGHGWRGVIQEYAYAPGSLFVVYAAPGQVTDIVLQEGEQLTGEGPIAAGDTAQWIIGDTVSGAGERRRVHILVKPLKAGLRTSAVINTDRRTYYLELASTPRQWMTAVAWRHPEPPKPPAWSPPAPSHTRYRIHGSAAWRPVRVWDDGRQVVIEFDPAAAAGELPPLVVLDGRRKPRLVNYRVRDRWMVVDRLFTEAELRLGGKDGEKVRLIREAADAG